MEERDRWPFLLFAILLALFVQGLYSMLEMACVSFNKIRLQQVISQSNRRARWLNQLLNHPIYLFGVTLIGVNFALQFGSECARRFYLSLHLSPDWAPFSQLFLVLIFAELVPMFVARRHAESVAVFGVPLLYFTSLCLRPIIWILDGLCHLVHLLFGIGRSSGLYLTREELQNMMEQREEASSQGENGQHALLFNLFTLRNREAKEVMCPIEQNLQISVEATVAQCRYLFRKHFSPFLVIYSPSFSSIAGILYPRHLLRLSDRESIGHHVTPPWFISENSSMLESIQAFRTSDQSVAIVLSHRGLPIGLLTLDAIIDDLFGHYGQWLHISKYSSKKAEVFMDRSFAGNALISDLHRRFHIYLGEVSEGETLEGLMEHRLEHRPEKGDCVVLENFILKVIDSSLLTGTKILIQSII